MVTIATNMAGRGTDIVLGGKKEEQSSEEWEKIIKLYFQQADYIS